MTSSFYFLIYRKQTYDIMKEEAQEVIGGIFGLLFVAAIIIFLCYCAKEYKKNITEERALIEESIGKEVVIQGDTLMVISHQRGGFGHPYGFLLSNGLVVDNELVRKLIKENED